MVLFPVYNDYQNFQKPQFFESLKAVFIKLIFII